MQVTVRVFESRLRCECGQPVKSSDFREAPQGALGICRQCHKDLMAIDTIDAGEDDED